MFYYTKLSLQKILKSILWRALIRKLLSSAWFHLALQNRNIDSVLITSVSARCLRKSHFMVINPKARNKQFGAMYCSLHLWICNYEDISRSIDDWMRTKQFHFRRTGHRENKFLLSVLTMLVSSISLLRSSQYGKTNRVMLYKLPASRSTVF